MAQRETRLSENQLLLQIGPVGGVDNTTDPFNLDQDSAPLNVHPIAMSGFVPNRVYKALATPQGRVQNVDFTSIVPNMTNIIGVYVMFEPGNLVFSPSGSYMLIVGVNAVSNIVYVANYSTTGVFLGLLFSATVPSGTITPDFRASFIPYQQDLYITISGSAVTPTNSLSFRLIGANTLQTWGMLSPTPVAPAFAFSGTGLTGDYYYRFTGSSSDQESSPTVATIKVSPNNQGVRMNLPTVFDPNSSNCNIYRLGGSKPNWLQVGQVAVGTATFTDNTTDDNIGNGSPTGNTGQTLVEHRDCPPNMRGGTVFKERIWGFFCQPGNASTSPTYDSGKISLPSALWYSNYAEAWGFNNVDQVLPIGLNPADSTVDGDFGVGVATVGGMLLALKRKSIWAITGDTPADFITQHLFDIGCISTQSITQAAGLVFWLGEQGAFSFDGSSAPNYLSKGIKSFLDGLSIHDRKAAVGFYENQTWYLSFPFQGVTWCYYLPTQEWHQLPISCGAAWFDGESLQLQGARFGTKFVDTWFAAETDLGNPITSTLTTKPEDSGHPEFAKQYTYVLVEAPVQTGTLSVTIQCDPGRTGAPAPQTLSFDLSKGPRQLLSLNPLQTGTSVQVSLSMTSSQLTTVSKIQVYGSIKRELVAAGPG